MDEQKKSSTDILLPKTREMTINGEALVVRPLRVTDLVFFSREIQAALISIKAKNPDLKFAKEEAIDIVPLILAEAERLLGLFARSVKKDKAWLEQVDMDDFSELFNHITELNDFGKIMSNFMKGWNQLKTQKLPTSQKV